VTTQGIINENRKRVKANAAIHDPNTGQGCDSFKRVRLEVEDYPIPVQWIPKVMYKENKVCRDLKKHGSVEKYLRSTFGESEDLAELKEEFCISFSKLRWKYDFEYYAFVCLTIEDGMRAIETPFILNRGQRLLLKELEAQRLGNKPIRIVLLKARQWGGSTLIQLYMLWIQLMHKKMWHSIICAHVKEAAKHIRGMYERALKNYPNTRGENIELQPYQGTVNIKQIPSRGCRITVGSAEAPDSVRSQTAFMIHDSEVALFPATDNNNPEQLISATNSTVKRIPYSMIVYESTAKGTGNFYHQQYLLAKAGQSAFTAIFVPWFMIDIYSEELTVSEEEFVKNMNEYDKMCFEKGATLQNINWYHGKLSELASEVGMMQEYPTDDFEAFQHSGTMAFNKEDVERLRKSCSKPDFVGELIADESPEAAFVKSELREGVLTNIRFEEKRNGMLKIWSKPDFTELVSDRYVIAVDVAVGHTKNADFSVACVIDRYWMMYGGKPEVVAELRGHIDPDILVWKCAQLATYYSDPNLESSLLAVECNTYDTRKSKGFGGDNSEFIFDTISRYYSNLYAREPSTKTKEAAPPKYGFSTNRSTKPMIVHNYNSIIREDGYVERESACIDEARIYEKNESGSFGNVPGTGNHDDRLITRMIGLYLCYKLPFPTIVVNENNINQRTNIVGVSSI